MWKNSFGIRIVAQHKAGEGGMEVWLQGKRGGASRCFRLRLEPGTEKGGQLHRVKRLSLFLSA